MTTLTTPDSIVVWTNEDPASLPAASAAQATSVQEALLRRAIHTHKWENATERGETLDMAEGDLGYQKDSKTIWLYSGTAWQPLIAPSLDYPATLQGIDSLGNGVVTAQYARFGEMVTVEGSLQIGSSTTFNGAEFAVSLPVDQDGKYDVGQFEFAAGGCEFLRPQTWDFSGPVLIRANKPGFAALKCQRIDPNGELAFIINYVITGSFPVQLAAGDLISWQFSYQAAASN